MSWPVLRQPQALVASSDAAEWASGICDCCDDMTDCCCALWCCPCFACKITKEFGQCLCLPLLDACSCIRPVSMSMRVSVRHHYGIKVRLRLPSGPRGGAAAGAAGAFCVQTNRRRRNSNTCGSSQGACRQRIRNLIRKQVNQYRLLSSIRNGEDEEGEGVRGRRGGRGPRRAREVLPGAGRQPEPGRSAARLQEAQQETLQMRQESCQSEEHPPRSERSPEVHQQRRERDRGAGRRHAAHRRLLPPAGHVRGQRHAVRLHPLQSGSGFVCGLQEADLRDPDQTSRRVSGRLRRVCGGGVRPAQTSLRHQPISERLRVPAAIEIHTL